MRLTVGNIKGGVAKTTSAIYLAIALERAGGRVLLVDADPEQQTATKWAGLAAHEWPKGIEVTQLASRDLAKQVRTRSAGFDHVVIDTSPKNPHLLRQALVISDVLLIPVRAQPATVADVPATYAVALDVADEHESGLDVSVLLVEARGRSPRSLAGDARSALVDRDLPVLDAQIRPSNSYALAYGHVPDDLGDYADVYAELTAEPTEEG
jgi:chromosome partitioning protein